MINKSLKIILLFFIVVVIPLGFLAQQSGTFSPQSRKAIEVVQNDNFFKGIVKYPKVWPPAYPSLLWAFNKGTGLDAKYFNLLCFSLSLLLITFLTQKLYSNIPFYIPAIVLSINQAMYFNIYQLTSDTMFLLLSLTTMLFVSKYIERPSKKTALILGGLTGFIALTRYFGLIWIFPLIILYMFTQQQDLKQKLINCTLYSFAAFLSCISWFIYVKQTTGSFTGMDRTQERVFPKELSDWNSLTNLDDNIWFSLKTYTYDIFSPFNIAEHHIVNKAMLNNYEYFLLFLTVLIILYVIIVPFVKSFYFPMITNPGQLFRVNSCIPIVYFSSYLAAIIIIWTYGNNDPIYTRFLFPSYAFLALGVAYIFNSLDKKNNLEKFFQNMILIILILYVNNNIIFFSR